MENVNNMNKLRKTSKILTIIIAIIIIIMSSIPFETAQSFTHVTTFKSVLYHFSIFFLLAIFFLMSFDSSKSLFSMVFLILFGILDEIHQIFTPGRSCSTADFVIDFTGILFAYFIYNEVKNAKNTNNWGFGVHRKTPC